MRFIARFLRKAKSAKIDGDFVFVSGDEGELDPYIDFFDDNDWLWVSDKQYKKRMSKLTERDKMKLKTDFFFDNEKPQHEILNIYKAMDKKFYYLTDIIMLLKDSFQFDLEGVPTKAKKIIQSVHGIKKGRFFIVSFNDMSSQNLKKIMDALHQADSDMVAKYD